MKWGQGPREQDREEVQGSGSGVKGAAREKGLKQGKLKPKGVGAKGPSLNSYGVTPVRPGYGYRPQDRGHDFSLMSRGVNPRLCAVGLEP